MAVIVEADAGGVFLRAELVARGERTRAGEDFAERRVSEGGENTLVRGSDADDIAVEVVEVAYGTARLRGGEDAADAAGGAANFAREVGAVGVGFEDIARAVGDGQHEPVFVNVAVGGGGAVGGVVDFFAAAPEGVVAGTQDAGAVRRADDVGQLVRGVVLVLGNAVARQIPVGVEGVGGSGGVEIHFVKVFYIPGGKGRN